MKMVANFVHVLLVMGMVYPVYAMWNNDQVDNFCVELQSNMTKQFLLDLAEQKNITLNIDDINEVKWNATAKTSATFSKYSCQIRGMGDRVASAKMAANEK